MIQKTCFICSDCSDQQKSEDTTTGNRSSKAYDRSIHEIDEPGEGVKFVITLSYALICIKEILEVSKILIAYNVYYSNEDMQCLSLQE